MKVNELTSWLEEHYPADVAEDWDNVGLLVGDDEKEINHVLLALDLTESVLEQALLAGADMLVTHHPMIFSGIKKINNHTSTGRKILSLIRNGISYYAVHTNYDIIGMAGLSAKYLALADTKVLSVTQERDGCAQGFGRIGRLPRKMTLRQCGEYVKECNHLTDVRVYGDLEQEVEYAAICTGSGKSMIREAVCGGAQVYITGDIDYHTAIDTVAEGLALIDAGHYGTEYIFAGDMKDRLEEAFPALKISCARVENPYIVL